MVRVHHGSSNKINDLRAAQKAALFVFARICRAHFSNHLLATRIVVDHRGSRRCMPHQQRERALDSGGSISGPLRLLPEAGIPSAEGLLPLSIEHLSSNLQQ
jgi:hypothetical protein